LKKLEEIKGKYLNDEIIKRIFKKIIQYDFKCFSIVMEKEKHKKILNLKNKNDIYFDMVLTLLNNIGCSNKILIMDNFFPKRQKDKYLKQFEINLKKSGIQILFEDSQKEFGIQIADVVSWATFQKYENKDQN
jgi:hypothetical protein